MGKDARTVLLFLRITMANEVKLTKSKFTDGPPLTRLRYCINSASFELEPQQIEKT